METGDKKFDYGKATEYKLRLFLERHNMEDKYPIKELSRWHTILCRSCPAGKIDFAKKHNLDLKNGTMTVPEFIELVRDAHGSSVIKKMEDMIANGVTPKKKPKNIFGL